MANGFPDGEFYILSTQTMLCLAANPGGGWSQESLGAGGGTITYSGTNPPVVQVETPKPPGKNGFEGWYFDTDALEYHDPPNFLVSRMKVASMGRFALTGQDSWTDSSPLEMWGVGRDDVSQWQAEDGYIFRSGAPDDVLSIGQRGGTSTPELRSRGGDYQRWHFIPFTA